MQVKRYIVGLVLLVAVSACQHDFLDVKPNKMYVILNKVQDYQALLDNSSVMNTKTTPVLEEIGADNFSVTGERWEQTSNPLQRYGYIWAKEVYKGYPYVHDWNVPYTSIYYSNLVLEGLDKLTTGNGTDDWKNAKGSAFFHRSWAFYHLAQLFCKPYSENATNDLGIPLRLKSDIQAKTTRSTVKQVYDQIVKDLKLSLLLLPDHPLVKTRPSKAAAYGLLARVYLLTKDYKLAKQYADSCIMLVPNLLDYNQIDIAMDYPFEQLNEEVIFHSTMLTASLITDTRANIDSILYRSYHENDLRKEAFFKLNNGVVNFRGSYDGTKYLFSGIATSEIYLLRAECSARMNEIRLFKEDMDLFFKHRYRKPVSVNISENIEEALKLVLSERRKELVMRGIRWSDLRRLNDDPRFAKTLIRKLGEDIYELPPNSARYVLPIPDDVIRVTGIQQNNR